MSVTYVANKRYDGGYKIGQAVRSTQKLCDVPLCESICELTDGVVTRIIPTERKPLQTFVAFIPFQELEDFQESGLFVTPVCDFCDLCCDPCSYMRLDDFKQTMEAFLQGSTQTTFDISKFQCQLVMSAIYQEGAHNRFEVVGKKYIKQGYFKDMNIIDDETFAKAHTAYLQRCIAEHQATLATYCKSHGNASSSS